MTGLTVLAVVLVLALVVGLVLRRREGAVRASSTAAVSATRQASLRTAGIEPTPAAITVLHFSATWCGPCAAVRRIVGTVATDLAADGLDVRDVEVDMDDNPALAREMGVMSLPTTFVLDASLVERSRASGVPTARDLGGAIRAAAERSA